MGKYILLLPAALFPYWVVYEIYTIFAGTRGAFDGMNLSIIQGLVLAWLIAAAFVVAFMILAIWKRWDAVQLTKANMLIKLLQIPAYVIIFGLAVIMLITIFTAILTVILFLVDLMVISLSGLAGLTAILRGNFERRLGKKQAILFAVSQFIFCVDVVCAVHLYRRLRRGMKTAA